MCHESQKIWIYIYILIKTDNEIMAIWVGLNSGRADMNWQRCRAICALVCVGQREEDERVFIM